MNLMYMRDAHLDKLKAAIKNNIEHYQKDEPWLDDYFEEAGWSLPSKLHVDELTLTEPTDAEHFDLENTIKIYEGLKNLSVTQASDERLWVYLTHVTFWKYMRLRWPVENYLGKSEAETAGNIRERYFFAGKPLVRNGIARLWWYGYVSYDKERNDPFELTKILLSKLDIAQNLLERSFSLNPVITKTILSVLADLKKEDSPLPGRHQFRELLKYINMLGGVTVLDALNADEFRKIVEEKLQKIMQQK